MSLLRTIQYNLSFPLVIKKADGTTITINKSQEITEEMLGYKVGLIAVEDGMLVVNVTKPTTVNLESLGFSFEAGV